VEESGDGGVGADVVQELDEDERVVVRLLGRQKGGTGRWVCVGGCGLESRVGGVGRGVWVARWLVGGFRRGGCWSWTVGGEGGYGFGAK